LPNRNYVKKFHLHQINNSVCDRYSMLSKKSATLNIFKAYIDAATIDCLPIQMTHALY